jgi:hypothetical protein
VPRLLPPIRRSVAQELSSAAPPAADPPIRRSADLPRLLPPICRASCRRSAAPPAADPPIRRSADLPRLLPRLLPPICRASCRLLPRLLPPPAADLPRLLPPICRASCRRSAAPPAADPPICRASCRRSADPSNRLTVNLFPDSLGYLVHLAEEELTALKHIHVNPDFADHVIRFISDNPFPFTYGIGVGVLAILAGYAARHF